MEKFDSRSYMYCYKIDRKSPDYDSEKLGESDKNIKKFVTNKSLALEYVKNLASNEHIVYIWAEYDDYNENKNIRSIYIITNFGSIYFDVDVISDNESTQKHKDYKRNTVLPKQMMDIFIDNVNIKRPLNNKHNKNLEKIKKLRNNIETFISFWNSHNPQTRN